MAYWTNNGCTQLYWQIGHPTADYAELIRWWNDHAAHRPLFIGEDVERTAKYPDPQQPARNQLPAKMELHRSLPGVQGTVLWYAKAAVDNIGNYGSNLRQNYWRYPALQPLMAHLTTKAPGKVRKLKPLQIGGQQVLFWTAPKGRQWDNEAVRYVVYRFVKGEKINLDDPSHIVAITADCHHELSPLEAGRYVYVVTALNRLHNESKAVKRKLVVR